MRNRRLSVGIYGVHAHGQALGSRFPYYHLFRGLSYRSPADIVRPVEDDLHFTVEGVKRNGRAFFGQVIAIEHDELLTFFDYRVGAVDTQSPPVGKSIARTARFAYVESNEGSRRLFLELRRGSVSASRFAEYLTKISPELVGGLGATFSLPPIYQDVAIEEINSLERIRVASVEYVRPNVDWDEYEDAAAQVADESDAGRVALTAYARRGDTLSRSSGIVPHITEGILRDNSNVASFKITGQRAQGEKEIVLSSAKYPRRERLEVPPGATAEEVDKSFVEMALRITALPGSSRQVSTS